MNSVRIYNNNTLFCEVGVANSSQVRECIADAIDQADKVLGYATNCKFRVNLIMDKEGKYFGFGYVTVSDPKIYWMLLGRNPDGSERVEEYPDPNWVPPSSNTSSSNTPSSNAPSSNSSSSTIQQDNKNKSWYELTQEEDAKIQPMLRRNLPPLIKISRDFFTTMIKENI